MGVCTTYIPGGVLPKKVYRYVSDGPVESVAVTRRVCSPGVNSNRLCTIGNVPVPTW